MTGKQERTNNNNVHYRGYWSTTGEDNRICSKTNTSAQPYGIAGISNLLGSKEARIDRDPIARISHAGRSPAQRMLMGVQPMLIRPFWVAFS